MSAKDADSGGSAAAGPALPVAADAVAAAARLRGALERAGFEVDRDFTAWDAVADEHGSVGVRIGELGVATANRLWALLERCASSSRSSRLSAAAKRAPRRRDGHAPEEARRAAARLRAELKRVGFDLARDFACCVADCTTTGMGLVRLGILPTSTANTLSGLIEALAESASDQPRGHVAG